jgi:metal-sulfur cluster biosynthetic enzyme
MTDDLTAPTPGETLGETPGETPATTTPENTSDAVASSDAPAAFSVDQARLVLRRVKDPELNLNIVDLGLVYDVTVVGNDVRVDMSLTSPGCPSGPEIMGEAEKELRTLPGIGEAVVNLVWSPAWTPERIEPRVRAYMGF